MEEFKIGFGSSSESYSVGGFHYIGQIKVIIFLNMHQHIITGWKYGRREFLTYVILYWLNVIPIDVKVKLWKDLTSPWFSAPPPCLIFIILEQVMLFDYCAQKKLTLCPSAAWNCPWYLDNKISWLGS